MERRVAFALGFVTGGALSAGAVAVGAMAIGALAIGRLAIGRLTIREMTVGRLRTGASLPDNRSVPRGTIVPEVPVRDVEGMTDWLSTAFGFTLRVGMGAHRAQLNAGDGAVVLTDSKRHGILVRVANVDAMHARAVAHGATIVRAPADYPYGERQFTCEDPNGQHWTFSQTIADAAPEAWGGMSGELG